MSRLAITGVGLITSLGQTAVASAAALRAGLSRPQVLPLTTFDPDTLGKGLIYGHPIVGVTDGWEGLGLYAMLARVPIAEASAVAGLDRHDPTTWKTGGLFVAITTYRDKEFEFVDEIYDEDLVLTIARVTDLPARLDHQQLVRAGHAGVLTALAAAAKALSQGTLKRALVVGVDSLLKEEELGWLNAGGRLKTADNPTGLQPGEAAGAIWVEREADADKRGAKVLAWLDNVQVDRNRTPRQAGDPGDAAALARAIRRCLGTRRSVGTVYADLNGETDRAMEWGLALQRLGANIALPAVPRTPATSLGDTGAASGAVALAAAVYGFTRGDGTDDCLICSSADTGEVGAALLLNATSQG